MNITSYNNYCVCSQVESNTKQDNICGFTYTTQSLPLYKILILPVKYTGTFIKKDDIVIIGSEPTQIKTKTGESLFLVNIDHIASVIDSL